MKRFLEEALISIQGLEKEASYLKDEVLAAFDQHFKREKEYVSFFYLNLDLIRMDLFKVVRGCQLVDNE